MHCSNNLHNAGVLDRIHGLDLERYETMILCQVAITSESHAAAEVWAIAGV